MFRTLDSNLAPTFDLDVEVRGSCFPRRIGCGRAEAADPTAPVLVDTGIGGPTVTAEGTVGPYDYLVLEGSSASVTTYLQDNAFDVTEALAPALAPYTASSGRFLAIRLRKDADVGDIAPLGFRYPGTVASIPIQLTAIAAARDMGVQVHVFGAHRAVPENYHHVVVDEAAIDWFDGGSNYYDVVARAVDQAGGHRFVTEFAGDPSRLEGTLWGWRQVVADEMAEAAVAGDFQVWQDGLSRLGMPADESVRYALEGFVDATGQLDPASDLSLLQDQVEERLFAPRRRAEALFEHPWVTRMATTLDPSEMTLDPLFVLDPLLTAQVDNERAADLVVDCRGSRTSRNARRELILEDGRSYRLDQASMDPVWAETDNVALRIEDLTGAEPVVLVDNDDVAARASEELAGRGCSGAALPTGAFGGLALVGLLGARRRR